MKIWFSILLLALAARGAPAVAAEPAPNLFRVRTLLDAQGQVHQIGSNSAAKATIITFLGPECPVSQRYVPELNRIAALCRTNGIEFYGVVSARKNAKEMAQGYVKDYSINFPVLVDDRLTLARWLAPSHVPEAYVLKPDGDVVYRGRIDDWYEAIGKPRAVVRHRELRDAIDSVLAGRTPAKAYARPVGCYFEELAP